MIQHPAIKPALTKEINFFNWSYDKPQNWYNAHFPTKFKKNSVKMSSKNHFSLVRLRHYICLIHKFQNGCLR